MIKAELYAIENMRVCQVYYEGFELEAKDWELARKHFTFSHKDVCEFIFYLGTDNHLDQVLLSYKTHGFSKLFLDYCKRASSLGYNYICFYC